MTVSSTDSRTTSSPPRRSAAGVIGRIGAVFAALLGIVHAVVNTMGFARLGFGPWLDYLTFGLGLTVIAFALAVLAWLLADHPRPPWAGIVFLGLGGVLLSLQLAGIAITDPALLVRPLGPGLWSLVAGPALVIETVVLATRRVRGRSEPASR